jgi:hypothetical protein
LSSAEHGYLLDLRLAGDDARAAFAHSAHGYPLEGDSAKITLADEFDGVVFLPRVTASAFE